MKRATRLLLCVALASCASSPDAPPSVATAAVSAGPAHEKWIVPANKHASGDANVDCHTPDTTPIQWNGGPVIHGTINVYLLYYGLHWTQTDTSILYNLVSYLGGSPYYSINTGYYDSSGNVSNSVRFAGQAYLNNVYNGNSISDGDVWSFVQNEIFWNQFPADPNGLYLVLGDQQTNETSGFCTDYCGWHTHTTYNGVDIKYGFVGNPAFCSNPLDCLCVNTTSSPNSDPGIDGMASIIVHEVEEAHTDPDGNAWYGSDGAENADHCAWTYGNVQTAPNGSYYNVTLGPSNFLIQQNWYSTGGCSLSCSDATHTMCNGVCTNLSNNNQNCGSCGNDCSVLGAGYRCMNGVCGCAGKLCCGGDVCASTCPRFCP